jgi:transcriptional regulator with XRE-family HTH domain
MSKEPKLHKRFPHELYQKIGQIIEDRRKFLGLTQQDVGNSIKVDRTRISITEGGKHLEDGIILFLIAEKLQTPISSFFPEETKRLVKKEPQYPYIFNLLPEKIKINVCLSQEAFGSISSSQLSALLEIFKKNPWGQIRKRVATIFSLLSDSWASEIIMNEMEGILLPKSGEELRFHTRLLAAKVLSSFVITSDGSWTSRGKKIKQEIEQEIESKIPNIQDIDRLSDFVFWLRALSEIGVKSSSIHRMEEYHRMIYTSNSTFTVNHLMFADRWGEFYRKDNSKPGECLKDCLNQIVTENTVTAYDFCLKIWSETLISKNYELKGDWLKNIFLSEKYTELNYDKQAIIIIVCLSASIQEFEYRLDPDKENKKVIITELFEKLSELLDIVNNSLTKVWVLQLLLLLRKVERKQKENYAIGLGVQQPLDKVHKQILDILRSSSSNPLEIALGLDFILSSRLEKEREEALTIIFEIINSNLSNQQLLCALLIDVFSRPYLEIDNENANQEVTDDLDGFRQNPFTYMCRKFSFDDTNSNDDNGSSSVEESWVCSAILRQEKSADAHKYFLPAINTTPCKSLSCNYKIGDTIGGEGVRYNLPSEYNNKSEDWWIWRIKDDDGDIYTLYSCQTDGLILSRFINENQPADSGFILFKNIDFSDGLYLYNSNKKPFWGGSWTVEDVSYN